MMKDQSFAQQQRQRARTNGKYDAGPKCELCGKPAGWNYWSPAGDQCRGLVVCSRRACVKPFEQSSEPSADIAARIIAEHGGCRCEMHQD